MGLPNGRSLCFSHCVPWPPDKGRPDPRLLVRFSFLDHHRVHLAALARSETEAAASSELHAEQLSSVHIEVRLIRSGCRPRLRRSCRRVVLRDRVSPHSHAAGARRRDFAAKARWGRRNPVVVDGVLYDQCSFGSRRLGRCQFRVGSNFDGCASPALFSGWKGCGCARSSDSRRCGRGARS